MLPMQLYLFKFSLLLKCFSVVFAIQDVSFDRFSKLQFSIPNYNSFADQIRRDKMSAAYPKFYYIPKSSSSAQNSQQVKLLYNLPLPDKMTNFLLFNMRDEILRSFPLDYITQLIVNPNIYPQQRVRLLEVASSVSSYRLGDVLKQARELAIIDPESRIWDSEVTMQRLLFHMFERHAGFMAETFPQLSLAEYQQVFSGISFEWIDLMNFNRDAMLYFGTQVQQSFWNSHKFLCQTLLNIFVEDLSEVEYTLSSDLGALLPCLTPAVIKELHRRQRNRIGARLFSNMLKPLFDVYETSKGEAAPNNRMAAQAFIDSLIEVSVFDKNEQFFKTFSQLLPFMSVKNFENSLYNTRREKGIARLVANFSDNYILLERLEYELSRSVSSVSSSRSRQHSLVSWMPNIGSGNEICRSLESQGRSVSDQWITTVKEIAEFKGNLFYGKQIQILQCYLQLAKRPNINLAVADEVGSLIKGAMLDQLPVLKISEREEHVNFLKDNVNNFTPLQRYHFLEQEDDSSLHAGALLSLGEHYLSEYGIFRLNRNNLLSDIGFKYNMKDGLVNINPVDHKTVEGDADFKLLLLDLIGSDFKLTPELARRHNFAECFVPSHLDSISDGEFFDTISLLDSNSLKPEVLMYIAKMARSWKQTFEDAQDFTLLDLSHSQISALGGHVLQHFQMKDFEGLERDKTKCKSIFGEIGQAIRLQHDNESPRLLKAQALANHYVKSCAIDGLPRDQPPLIQFITERDLIVLGNLVCFLNEHIYKIPDSTLLNSLHRFADCQFSQEQATYFHNKLASISISFENHVLDYPELLDTLGPNICLVFSEEELSRVFDTYYGNFSENYKKKFLESVVRFSSKQIHTLPADESVQNCASLLIEESMLVLENELSTKVSDSQVLRNNWTVTCSRLRHLREGIKYLAPDHFSELSALELERCLEFLTHHEHVTKKQLSQIWNLVNKYSLTDELFASTKSQAMLLVNAQQVGNLASSVFEKILDLCEGNQDFLYLMGKLPELDRYQWSNLFQCARSSITDMTGKLTIKGVKIAGNLLCGASEEEISQILTPKVALATLADLGQSLRSCSPSQLKVIFNIIQSDSTKWSPPMISSAKVILGGLSSSDLIVMTAAKIEHIDPQVFLKMSDQTVQTVVNKPDIINRLTYSQLLSLEKRFESRAVPQYFVEKLFNNDEQLIKMHYSPEGIPNRVGSLVEDLQKRENGKNNKGDKNSLVDILPLTEVPSRSSNFVYIIVSFSTNLQSLVPCLVFCFIPIYFFQ